MKFTEVRLEQAIIDLLGKEGYPHVLGETVGGATRRPISSITKKWRYLGEVLDRKQRKNIYYAEITIFANKHI
jgi:hypothetical protein